VYKVWSASLLEVGTGFNGEMTVEKIFIWTEPFWNDQERNSPKIDEIIEFSVVSYIDTPKRYSSGMTVRLFCSCSIPWAWNFDNRWVLAVGDAEFQKSHWQDAGYFTTGRKDGVVCESWRLSKSYVLNVFY
jgi:ABC-type polysaccharide/polyol phosphate transport system ATPase subunit